MNIEIKFKHTDLLKTQYAEKLFNIFLCFLTYSFCGWVIETIYMTVYHGHLVKRGFLLGPLCVVYGFASILVVGILKHVKSHPSLLFLSAVLLTSSVELIAGMLLNGIIHLRLWDYSSEFINYKGYICLQNSLLWGVLSLLLVYVFHPALVKFVVSIPSRAKELIFYSTVICLSVDITISVYTSLNGISTVVWISQVFFNRLP